MQPPGHPARRLLRRVARRLRWRDATRSAAWTALAASCLGILWTHAGAWPLVAVGLVFALVLVVGLLRRTDVAPAGDWLDRHLELPQTLGSFARATPAHQDILAESADTAVRRATPLPAPVAGSTLLIGLVVVGVSVVSPSSDGWTRFPGLMAVGSWSGEAAGDVDLAPSAGSRFITGRMPTPSHGHDRAAGAGRNVMPGSSPRPGVESGGTPQPQGIRHDGSNRDPGSAAPGSSDRVASVASKRSRRSQAGPDGVLAPSNPGDGPTGSTGRSPGDRVQLGGHPYGQIGRNALSGKDLVDATAIDRRHRALVRWYFAGE
jgi:hypothetical protein